MKNKLLPVLALLTSLLCSCIPSDPDTPTPQGAKRYIHEEMQWYYYWFEEVPASANYKSGVSVENFFNGLGTIVVGAAMKHENPFVQLFNLWGSEEKELSRKSVLSAFDPPSYVGGRVTNYIWTMSAARAAVRDQNSAVRSPIETIA